MTWTKGFNFRRNASFVTDGPNETYVLAGDNFGTYEAYPVTRNGVTFGYTSVGGGSCDDLNNSVDPRVAGRTYAHPGTKHVVRIDLPAAGNYVIRLANGNTEVNDQLQQHVIVKDDTTQVLAVEPATVSGFHFYDATGVDRTSGSDWVSNNASAIVTFASTICNLEIGGPDGYTVFAHFFLDQVAAAVIRPKRSHMLQMFR